MDKSYTFLLVGTGHYSNRGCEAIVRGTTTILSQYFPNSKFILSSFGRKEELELNAKNEIDKRIIHKIPNNSNIKRFSLVWWKYRIFLRHYPVLQQKYQFGVQMDALKEAHCALQIGGDNYSLDYGFPKKFVELDNALLQIGKPLILWGCSVGPFKKDKQIENFMRKHLKKFKLILARESETVSYLGSIGLEENVRLVADPAFLMEPTPPKLSEDILLFLKQKPIGLNLSPLLGKYRDQKQWFNDAVNCVKELITSKLGPILLVPHVNTKGQSDYKFMYSILQYLNKKNSSQIKILPPNLRAAEYKWCISQLKMFAGARTHSTIAALSENIPTISIGYSMKAKGINKDIFEHTKWLISAKELNPINLVDKFKELNNDIYNVKKILDINIPKIKKRAQNAAHYLLDILKKT